MNEPKTDKQVNAVCSYFKDVFMDNIKAIKHKKFNEDLLRTALMSAISNTVEHFKVKKTINIVNMTLSLFSVYTCMIEAGQVAMLESQKQAIQKAKVGADNETDTRLH